MSKKKNSPKKAKRSAAVEHVVSDPVPAADAPTFSTWPRYDEPAPPVVFEPTPPATPEPAELVTVHQRTVKLHVKVIGHTFWEQTPILALIATDPDQQSVVNELIQGDEFTATFEPRAA